MRKLIYVLLNYLNCSIKKDTNYYIARQMLLSINEIHHLSLEQMAELCNVSDSTLHRFCQTIVYQNYKSLRNSLPNHRSKLSIPI